MTIPESNCIHMCARAKFWRKTGAGWPQAHHISYLHGSPCILLYFVYMLMYVIYNHIISLLFQYVCNNFQYVLFFNNVGCAFNIIGGIFFFLGGIFCKSGLGFGINPYNWALVSEPGFFGFAGKSKTIQLIPKPLGHLGSLPKFCTYQQPFWKNGLPGKPQTRAKKQEKHWNSKLKTFCSVGEQKIHLFPKIKTSKWSPWPYLPNGMPISRFLIHILIIF